MELDITEFFRNVAPMDYSASVAEIGQDAGSQTWRAACEDSEDYPILDNEEKREAFRAFIRSSGGWNDAEITAMSDRDLNALCIQWIAGDMRNGGLHADMTAADWKDYQARAESGECSGSIFGGPLSVDGQVYFYIGS